MFSGGVRKRGAPVAVRSRMLCICLTDPLLSMTKHISGACAPASVFASVASWICRKVRRACEVATLNCRQEEAKAAAGAELEAAAAPISPDPRALELDICCICVAAQSASAPAGNSGPGASVQAAIDRLLLREECSNCGNAFANASFLRCSALGSALNRNQPPKNPR